MSRKHTVVIKVNRFTDEYIVWDMGPQVPIHVGTKQSVIDSGYNSKLEVERADTIGSSSYSSLGWWNGPGLLLNNRYLMERSQLKTMLNAMKDNRLDKFVEGLYDLEKNPRSNPYGEE